MGRNEANREGMPMELGTDDYREQLQALNQEFRDLLHGRLDEIESLWEFLAEGEWDREKLHAMVRSVHVLSGSANTFGYPALGRAAVDLERRLRGWIKLDRSPSAGALDQASALVPALRQAAARRTEAARLESLGRVADEDEEGRLIYLVEDDESLAKELRLQLFSFGYKVRIFTGCEDVAEAIAVRRPDALVLDVILGEGYGAGFDLMHDLQQELDLRELPVLFVTARGDVEARLEAVRCGAAGYFVKPLDVVALVDRLNRLTPVDGDEPFRILIVDDDYILAEHYAVVLRHGGMQVSVLNQPLEILDHLGAELPDLVLMDIDMPDCSGPELVKIIRQFDRFVSLPIVYLSTETDLERQLSALRIGGDDFLTKPITDRHLVTAVAIRAERSRVLRSLMNRDSLTGLLTHVALKEHLAAELARSRRTKNPLSFAMLDIDGFKQVNDRHGHLLGDRVLATLADLLRQRTRSSDAVGRYGGEEFGIVLPDCESQDGVTLIEKLREGFAGIRFRSADGELRVELSAGVATAVPGCSIDDLIERADRALYTAKSKGGNRVLAAGVE